MTGLPGIPGDPAPNPEAVIKGDKYRLTVLTPGLVRVEYSAEGVFEDRASTFAVNRHFPKPDCRFKHTQDGGVELVTERMRLNYNGGPFTPSGLHVVLIKKKDGVVGTSEWRYGSEDGENLGGTARTLDSVDGRCELGKGIISKNGISVIDDSHSMLFTSDGWVTTRSSSSCSSGKGGDSSDIYIFGYGSEHRQALQAFYAVSGRPPVLPRWALGNWWSRYHAYTDKQYLEVMDKFAADKIPLSVAVLDMDWHLVDIPPEYGAGWTGYTWNKELFPDHVAFLKKLHDRGLKTSLNTHPADGIRPFEESYKRVCKALGRSPDTKDPVEFDPTDRAFFDAYFKAVHHPLEDEGVDLWWLDWQQGQISKVPGIDPLWVLNHYHFIDSQRTLGRRMTFSRYAGPGSHRYPIGFSGDTAITWDSLHFQPEFTATASNIGFGWWSHDIGGHQHGIADDELLARWVQLGLFSPILRLHSTNNPFISHAPWTHSPECRGILNWCLRFRHRLVPYLYTMSVRAARRGGHALVEPMYYDHPNAADAYANKNQYLFGSELLVSPITSPHLISTQMGRAETYLPPGRYVDIFTGVVYEGDRVINMYRPTDGIPVLAAEGAILPLVAMAPYEGEEKVQAQNGTPLPDAIEVIVVVGKDGYFELVEDDGTAGTLEQAVLATTPICFDQAKGEITIGPTKNPLVRHRKWSVQLPGYAVHLSTTAISAHAGGHAVQSSVTKSFDGKHLIIEVDEAIEAQKTITIKLPSTDPQLRRNDTTALLRQVLDRARIPHDTKWQLWNILEEDLQPKVLLSRLRAVDMDEHVMDAMMEYLLAQE